MQIEAVVDELWNVGFREADIAADLGITENHVLRLRAGKMPVETPRTGAVEVRHATIIEGHGSFRCRRVPVTLPYSGTMQ